jgi:sporulation protein YlmC with PRC-barrel domain
MKLSFRFLTPATVAVILAVPSLAGAQTQRERNEQRLRSAAPVAVDNRAAGSVVDATAPSFQLGPLDKASDVIGSTVVGSGGEDIAKVADLAVDIETGRVLLAILSYGGIAGVGADHTAVPISALQQDRSKEKTFSLGKTEADLKAAPKFDLSKWNESTTPSGLSDVYRSYGRNFEAEVRDPLTTPTRRADRTDRQLVVGREKDARDHAGFTGNTERASKLMGATIRNFADREVGKVDELLLDVPQGRIVDVVVSTGGFLGIGDEKSVVPPSILQWDNAGEVVHADATKEQLAAAPRFKASEWPDQDANYVNKVYGAFGATPYFAKPADNTARNQRDKEGGTLTPLNQGNSGGDLDTTAQIRKAVMAKDDLSIYAKNVKIITTDGKVTLRGTVRSDAEKTEIENLANEIAGADNVDNQLEVKPSAQ